MPPGPRKRRRQRLAGSSPGYSASADESHESDGTTSCPDTPDQGNRMLSSLGTPSDHTFQTEEWLRVSDFDVGTPSSTTADSKGDYDVATEESYGDGRGNYKLADWETVSRDTVGASSTEDVADNMEADHSVLEESVSSSQGQKLKVFHVDKGNSEYLSQEQDDHEKISPSSQYSSTKSEGPEKTSNCSKTGSPGVEEDQERACIEEFEQINQENGSTEVHENAKLTSSMGVQIEKLQDLQPCNIMNVSLPEVQQEDHLVTNSRQEDNTVISDALEEDVSIQGRDVAISGMDGTSDPGIEAVDMAPWKLQEDNVKEVPERKHDELDQLVDIAHSTELAYLAKQEESFLALEEKDFGKNVSEPLGNMLAPAQDSSASLQHGEGEDLKMVIVEETALDQDSLATPDTVVFEEAEPVAMKQTSLIQHYSDGSDAGMSEEAEHSIDEQESALVEQSPNGDTLIIDAIPGEYENTHLSDHLSTGGHAVQTESSPAEMEKDNLTQQKSSSDPELKRTKSAQSRVRTNSADLGRGLNLGGSGGTPVDLMHYNSHQKSEEQVRPKERWDESSEIGGCCEPVHWILDQLFGRHIN